MPKGQLVSKQVSALVGHFLSEDEKMTGKELKFAVEEQIKGIDYTLRTYQKIKEKLKPVLAEMKASGIDRLWTIGACIKEDILVDVVVPIQRQLLSYGRFLTIRRARWYSKLHAVFSPLLEKAYPGQPDRNQIRLYQIASYYTRMEQIAEISGEAYPDTRALDTTYIINQDFSFKTSFRMWEGLYLQIPESKVMDEKASALKAEQNLSKEMTERQARLLNEFVKLEADGDSEKAGALVEKNPDIQPFVEKWMAFSLRRDIQISREKDGE